MNILIGIDFSDESLDAARQGFSLAQHLRQTGESCEVFAVHIVGSGPPHPSIGTSSLLDDADNLRKIEAKVKEFLLQTVTDPGAPDPEYQLILEQGRAREQLAKIARRLHADWLFVGRSGSGALVRLVLGSTSQTLAHNPPCPLAIAHERAPNWANTPRLAVAVDFSEHAERALRLAITLARSAGAQLHLLHAVYPATPTVMPERGLAYGGGGEYLEVQEIQQRAEADMALLEKKYSDQLSGLSWTREVLTGYPSREIVAYAEDHQIDALLMGTVGRSAFDNFLLGSVADAVVKHTPCTIYLTPPGDE